MLEIIPSNEYGPVMTGDDDKDDYGDKDNDDDYDGDKDDDGDNDDDKP